MAQIQAKARAGRRARPHRVSVSWGRNGGQVAEIWLPSKTRSRYQSYVRVTPSVSDTAGS